MRTSLEKGEKTSPFPPQADPHAAAPHAGREERPAQQLVLLGGEGVQDVVDGAHGSISIRFAPVSATRKAHGRSPPAPGRGGSHAAAAPPEVRHPPLRVTLPRTGRSGAGGIGTSILKPDNG